MPETLGNEALVSAFEEAIKDDFTEYLSEFLVAQLKSTIQQVSVLNQLTKVKFILDIDNESV